MIIVLNDSIASAKSFINRLKINNSCFILTNLFKLKFNASYDPSIGFDTGDGIVHLSTKSTINAKRIGILGDSTTVINQRFEKSWAEYLTDKADFDMEFFISAMGSHSSSQILIKLIRDMSHMNLDTVIYYGCINEIAHTEIKNHFVHRYQQKLFKKLDSMRPKGIKYESGISDCFEHWIHQVRMMHGVCNELKIKFYAIIAPILTLKKPRSNRDIELLEHIFPSLDSADEEELTIQTKLLCDKVNEKEHPYIYDFTDIFNSLSEDVFIDRMHIYDHANEIIAKHVIDIIKSDMVN